MSSDATHRSSVRRLVALALGLCMALGVSSATATPPAAASMSPKCMPLGIGSNYQWKVNLPNAMRDLPRLKRDGVTSIREDILWSVVQEHSSREWNWSSYDTLFTTMSRLRVQVLPILGYSPNWVSPTSDAHGVPRSRSGQLAYARFAAAAVRRYGVNGTFWRSHRDIQHPLPVRAVELWNEPWYTAHPSVRAYVSTIRLAGAAIHRVSRRTLTAANVDDRWTHVTDSRFHLWGQAVLQYSRQLTGYVNRWAVHPYSEGQWTHLAPATDSMRQITWLQQQLAAAHAHGLIWITEVGFSTALRHVPSVESSMRSFVSAVRKTRGPHRVSMMWIFTSSRTTQTTKPGSWDYGFNLINKRGAISPEVSIAHAAGC